jgi:hypothetical protein
LIGSTISIRSKKRKSFKHHYMTYYWKVRKYFLHYIEDPMSHDSLIGSTISIRSKKRKSLNRHYMTFYWKVRKDFLDYIEHSMSLDSLIGSTISTRSKKSVSCASKISSASVLSHDTKTSKVSEKDNPYDSYSKNFNHAFLPKPDFEGYRNNVKKESEEKQNFR